MIKLVLTSTVNKYQFSKLLTVSENSLQFVTQRNTNNAMMQFLKKVFSPSEPVDFKELLNDGAQIIDVRTPNEFRGGHIKPSKNIPLQDLSKKMGSLKKHKTYILCCASGGRSGSAKRMLSSAGFENVHNGGGWMKLERRLQA